MKTNPTRSTACLGAMLAIVVAVPAAAQTTWFVDNNPNVTGPRNGTSWSTAYEFLQDAITDAVDLDTIRVADGTYYPDDDDDMPASTHTPDNRNHSFVLKHDVVASGVLVWAINGLLEHGAVHDAHRTGIAAPTDANGFTSLEAVVMAHMGTVATGHASGQREGVRPPGTPAGLSGFDRGMYGNRDEIIFVKDPFVTDGVGQI